MKMSLVLAFLWVGVSSAQASPLSLAEAVDVALRQNPAVRGAVETARAADARVGQARAPWLPQLNASTQLRGNSSYQTGVTQGSEAVNTLRYSGALQLSQMIYDFGRTTARIGGASLGAEAAQSDREATRAQIALRVINSYYAVLQAEALRDVGRRTLEQQQQRRLQAESFFRIGTRPEIDVLIARTAVANADLALVQAENNIWLARAGLLEALGVQTEGWHGWLGRPLQATASPPLPIETGDMQGSVPAAPAAPSGAAAGPTASDRTGQSSSQEAQLDAMLDQALSHRPDYAAARQRVQQAEASLRAVRSDYLPQLSLGLNGQVSGSIGGNTVGTVGGTSRLDVPNAGQPGFGLTGTLNVAWPVLSGLTTVYAVREATATLQAAQASLDALRLSMRSQLLTALYQLTASNRTVQAAKALATQADLQLQMARGRYQAGVGNAIEMGDSAVAAASAQAQYIQAQYALYNARATLLWHLGQLIPGSRT